MDSRLFSVRLRFVVADSGTYGVLDYWLDGEPPKATVCARFGGILRPPGLYDVVVYLATTALIACLTPRGCTTGLAGGL